MDLFLNMVRGFCMALADSVPGVSGGTIAFVLGFYDEFISSLYVLTHGSRELKLEGIRFLAKLGMGWVIGMGSSVLVIASLFTSRIYELSSLFLGFSIFSLPLIIKEEKECLRRTSRIIYMDAIEGGRVEERLKEEGAMVKAGDVILRLSNPLLNIGIMQSEADLAYQENELHNTRISMEQ